MTIPKAIFILPAMAMKAILFIPMLVGLCAIWLWSVVDMWQENKS